MKNLKQVTPVRRDVRNELPEDLSAWHPDGLWTTSFMNALSTLFPAGELYFIRSVRAYKDKEGASFDELLAKQVKGFIAQEALHRREHLAYNEKVFTYSSKAKKIEVAVAKVLGWASEKMPSRVNLAVTCALEHWTATLAEGLMRNPELLEKVHPELRQLYAWHAYEETEHKAVSFDVWTATKEPSFQGKVIDASLRASSYLIASAILWAILAVTTSLLVYDARRIAKSPRSGLLTLAKTLLGKSGVVGSQVRELLDYFKPGFHPWDHDNSERLEKHKDSFKLVA